MKKSNKNHANLQLFITLFNCFFFLYEKCANRFPEPSLFDTQKQKYADWEKNYNQQVTKADPTKAIKTDQIYVPSSVTAISNDVQVHISQPTQSEPRLPFNGNDYLPGWRAGSAHEWAVWNPQDGLTITWHNAAKDSSGRLLNITWTIDHIVNAKTEEAAYLKAASSFNQQDIDYLSTPVIIVYSNPTAEIGWGAIAGLHITENLTYADNGQPYTGTYYRSAGSLSEQSHAHGDKLNRNEFVSPVSGVVSAYLPTSGTVIQDTTQSVTGLASQSASSAYYADPSKIDELYTYGDDSSSKILSGDGVTFLVKNGNTLAYGTSVDTTDIANSNTFCDPYQTHIMGNTGSVAPVVPQPTTEVHYHYNTSTVKLAIPS